MQVIVIKVKAYETKKCFGEPLHPPTDGASRGVYCSVATLSPQASSHGHYPLSSWDSRATFIYTSPYGLSSLTTVERSLLLSLNKLNDLPASPYVSPRSHAWDLASDGEMNSFSSLLFLSQLQDRSHRLYKSKVILFLFKATHPSFSIPFCCRLQLSSSTSPNFSHTVLPLL